MPRSRKLKSRSKPRSTSKWGARARAGPRSRGSRQTNACNMTKAQLKKHACYKQLPPRAKYNGKTKSKLSSDELCHLYMTKDCFFSTHRTPPRSRSRSHSRSRSRSSVRVPLPSRSLSNSRSRSQSARARAATEVFQIDSACNNNADPVTLDDLTDDEVKAAYPNDVVSIFLPGQRKGECYNRSGLIGTWRAYINEDIIHYGEMKIVCH